MAKDEALDLFVKNISETSTFGTRTLLGAKGIATRNKCIASSNKCLTSSNKKLLETSATLVVTGALLVVTMTLVGLSHAVPARCDRIGSVVMGRSEGEGSTFYEKLQQIHTLFGGRWLHDFLVLICLLMFRRPPT